MNGDSVITMDRNGQWHHQVDINDWLEQDPGDNATKNYVVCVRAPSNLFSGDSNTSKDSMWTLFPLVLMAAMIVILLIAAVMIKSDRDVTLSDLMLSIRR